MGGINSEKNSLLRILTLEILSNPDDLQGWLGNLKAYKTIFDKNDPTSVPGTRWYFDFKAKGTIIRPTLEIIYNYELVASHELPWVELGYRDEYRCTFVLYNDGSHKFLSR